MLHPRAMLLRSFWMTPEEVAALHARAFDGQGRAWSADEFRNLLANPHVFMSGDTRAFALGRVIADEAELLMLATDPALRRHGLGRDKLCAYEAEARERGATSSFLEVAADNTAALSLYSAQGYLQTGCRKGYYVRNRERGADALVMRKLLA